MRSRYWKIEALPGISQEQQTLLQGCGITDTKQLLAITSTLQARQALASQLQIHPQYVNKWVALADLARIPSVGCQYCGLLLHSGITSVAQLVQTPIPRLHQLILKLHVGTMQRKDLCPTVDVVQQWILDAKAIAFD
jgi:hypothetical protein